MSIQGEEVYSSIFSTVYADLPDSNPIILAH